LMTPSLCSGCLLHFAYRRPCRRHNFRVRRLNRGRRLSSALNETMELKRKNLKLYMENQSLIKENEKLRNKALLLHQENQALLSQSLFNLRLISSIPLPFFP
ncbi:hypothetical protein CISIN_1g047307mg, partial [Citrus sinensis]